MTMMDYEKSMEKKKEEFRTSLAEYVLGRLRDDDVTSEMAVRTMVSSVSMENVRFEHVSFEFNISLEDDARTLTIRQRSTIRANKQSSIHSHIDDEIEELRIISKITDEIISRKNEIKDEVRRLYESAIPCAVDSIHIADQLKEIKEMLACEKENEVPTP